MRTTSPETLAPELPRYTSPDVPFTEPSQQSIDTLAPSDSSFRTPLRHSRLTRTLLTLTTATGLFTAASAVEVSPAAADEALVYTVQDTGDGVYARKSPHQNDTDRIVGQGAYDGDRIQLLCGTTNGDPVGPYNNRTWHKVLDLTNHQGPFWINDHWTDTPVKAGERELAPGEEECGTPSSGSNVNTTPSAKSCYFNMKAPNKNLNFSYSGDHRYLGNAWQAAKNWADAGIHIGQGSSNTYIRFKDVNITRDTVVDGVHVGSGTIAKAVIPEEVDWIEAHRTIPNNPHIPHSVTILANRHIMDSLNDFQRTYVLAHEIGHTLGLAHTERCGYYDKSIMNQGSEKNGIFRRTFNAPVSYDKLALKQLYNQ